MERRRAPQESPPAARGIPPFWLMVALSLAAGACRDSGAELADNFVTRDSAGIQIAESSGPSWAEGEAWSLSSEPLLEIGVSEGAPEYLLANVRDARRLPDGRILIADGASRQLRVYDPAGAYLRALGARGEGPGEFQSLDWFQPVSGDTLLLHDRQLRRISTFTLDGQYVGSTRLAEQAETDVPVAAGAFADGSLLGRASQYSSLRETDRPEIERVPLAFLHLSPSGEPLDSIAVLPGREQITVEAGGIILSMPVLFGRGAVGTVGRDRAYLGTNDSFSIGVYTMDGRLERLIRRREPLRPLPDEEVARIRSNLLERETRPQLREALRGAYSRMPVPETLPAYETLKIDDGGNLWVEETRLSREDEAPRWTIFDPAGRWLGTLQLPLRFQPMHLGEDFVLGVWFDPLDVQRVRLYGLEK